MESRVRRSAAALKATFSIKRRLVFGRCIIHPRCEDAKLGIHRTTLDDAERRNSVGEKKGKFAHYRRKRRTKGFATAIILEHISIHSA